MATTQASENTARHGLRPWHTLPAITSLLLLVLVTCSIAASSRQEKADIDLIYSQDTNWTILSIDRVTEKEAIRLLSESPTFAKAGVADDWIFNLETSMPERESSGAIRNTEYYWSSRKSNLNGEVSDWLYIVTTNGKGQRVLD